MNELCHLFGCSRMTIYRWMEQHKLPSPIRHKNKTKRLIGWDRREIEVMLRHR
ncbi:helix-turn-helix transcriptional regulator [Aeromonas veronii]